MPGAVKCRSWEYCEDAVPDPGSEMRKGSCDHEVGDVPSGQSVAAVTTPRDGSLGPVGGRGYAFSDDLCSSFPRNLSVSGASISVFDSSGNQSSVCSSDETAARIDELQFDLHEGPQWHTVRTGKIVLIPNVKTDSQAHWPIFGSALRQMNVGALFTIPLLFGGDCVGTVALYRDSPGRLTAEDLATANRLATSVASAAFGQAMASASDGRSPETTREPALRREVHQATGMILAQLDTSASVAYSRLQAHAFAAGRSVQDVARDVVTRQLRFSKFPE
jgi:GAF domain-containing protein